MKQISAVTRVRKVIGKGKSEHSGRGTVDMATNDPLPYDIACKLISALAPVTEAGSRIEQVRFGCRVTKFNLRADAVTDSTYRTIVIVDPLTDDAKNRLHRKREVYVAMTFSGND